MTIVYIYLIFNQPIYIITFSVTPTRTIPSFYSGFSLLGQVCIKDILLPNDFDTNFRWRERVCWIFKCFMHHLYGWEGVFIRKIKFHRLFFVFIWGKDAIVLISFLFIDWFSEKFFFFPRGRMCAANLHFLGLKPCAAFQSVPLQ